VQFSGGLLFTDRDLALQEHVTCIEREHHSLNAHAGRLISS
jgi:hypothetical protein